MGRQSDIFRASEAKAWLERNEHKLPLENDPVLAALRSNEIPYSSVLEVGCANGWRLYEIQDTTPDKEVIVSGIDPCIESEIKDKNLRIVNGTADTIPFVSNCFDLVIYGFCLYLCDPEDYFRIAAEGDRVLAMNGHICVFDFYSSEPYARQYTHHWNVMTRKRDFSKLWSWSPFYREISHTRYGNGEDRLCVSILKKVPETISVRI